MQSAILQERFARAIDIEQRVCEHVPTGIPSLDALTGGLPRGGITEIFGPPSSGRTSAMNSILAEATASNEVCALADGHDAFDPKSAAEAGVDLNRLLWIRCRKLDQVLKTTDLLLQGGGFGRVVMDLTDLPLSHIRSVPLASWFRFQRTIEKTPTVLLVMNSAGIVGSAAALVLQMKPQGRIEVVRCRAQRHVRVHPHTECIR
jgi:hypothetical protein